METIRQLATIENVRDRLQALASGRGVPENVVKQLKEESASLEWAFNQLRLVHLKETWMVVGDPNYVTELVKCFDASNIQLSDVDGLTTLVLIQPTEEVKSSVFKFLVPQEWHGNRLSLDKVPQFMLCRRYFASASAIDNTRRVLFFETDISSRWRWDRNAVDTWLVGLYKSIKWDEAKPVGG
jgi:hypothetical protein